jgi:hypothetical protein
MRWDDAIPATIEVLRKDGHRIWRIDLALLYERQKQLDRCRAMLSQVTRSTQQVTETAATNSGAELVELAKALSADLAQGGNAEFDVAEIEKRCATVSVRGQCSFHFLLGCYLKEHGKEESAIEQWKKCMACRYVAFDTRTRAGAALIERGIRPEDFENPLLPAEPVAKSP